MNDVRPILKSKDRVAVWHEAEADWRGSWSGHLSTPAALHYFNSVIDRDDLDPEFVKDVAANGIREPLEINTDLTHAAITEGHHRALAADLLGIPSLPVTVYRTQTQPGGFDPPKVENELAGLMKTAPWQPHERTAAIPELTRCMQWWQNHDCRVFWITGLSHFQQRL